MKWIPLAMGASGLAMLALAFVLTPKVKAATLALDEGDRYTPTHQLTVCQPGKPCEARGKPSGETACGLNETSDRWMGDLPAGTRIECRRVTR